MLGVVGQQCCVRLHGALPFRIAIGRNFKQIASKKKSFKYCFNIPLLIRWYSFHRFLRNVWPDDEVVIKFICYFCWICYCFSFSLKLSGKSTQFIFLLFINSLINFQVSLRLPLCSLNFSS